MDNIAVEIAKQVPSLGVLCFIVVVFLKYLERRDAIIREIHAEHLLERQHTRSAIDTNTSAMNKNTMAALELVQAVKQQTKNS